MSGGEGVRNPADLTPVINLLEGIEFWLALYFNWILDDLEDIDDQLDDVEAAIEANRLLILVVQAGVATALVDIATLQAVVDDIDDATQHVTSIFPDDTDLDCTFIAGTNAHTWSLWIEIIDSGATTLSSLFADLPGHLTSILIETVSDDTALYMYEIAWGADKVLLTSGRFAGVGKSQQAHIQDRFWTPPSPAGELIYYRMKSDTAVPDDCMVHFRYHLH